MVLGDNGDLPGLAVVVRTSFLLGLFFSFAFTAFVVPSSAGEPLGIKGIVPSSAYWNDTVLVYGVRASAGVRVIAMLAKISNLTFIVANGSSPWVDLGSGNLTVGSAVSGDLGDWQIGFVVPNVFPGVYVVYVSDGVSSDVVGFEVLIKVIAVSIGNFGNVSYLPFNITLSGLNSSNLPLLFFFSGNMVPSSGPPGSLVSMSGRFASGGQIVVYFDNANVGSVVGQKSGDWSAVFMVPYVSVGVHTVRAIDVGGRWISMVSFNVTSGGDGFSVPYLVLLGFFAVASFSGLLTFFLLVVSRKRKR